MKELFKDDDENTEYYDCGDSYCDMCYPKPPPESQPRKELSLKSVKKLLMVLSIFLTTYNMSDKKMKRNFQKQVRNYYNNGMDLDDAIIEAGLTFDSLFEEN